MKIDTREIKLESKDETKIIHPTITKIELPLCAKTMKMDLFKEILPQYFSKDEENQNILLSVFVWIVCSLYSI